MTEGPQAWYQLRYQTLENIRSLADDIRSGKHIEYTRRIRELEDELRAVKKAKRYGLVWEDKPEDVVEQCKRALPVLVADESRTIADDPAWPTHILIEGDNYHALSTLAYTHAGKIDVIYIDPPYNTGAKDWKYNNHYVDVNDSFRHSKWLSMMANRLKISRNVLKPEGVLIVAIDDYEVHTLGLLLEEYFPWKAIDLVVIEHHPQGAGSNTISRTHEYAFILTPIDIGFQWRVAIEEEWVWSLKRTGQGENNWRKNRPKQFFAILVNSETGQVSWVGKELLPDEQYQIGKDSNWNMMIYPLDREWGERCWRYNRKTMSLLIEQWKIVYTERWSLVVKKESVSAKPVFSVWKDSRYNAGTHWSTLLNRILGQNNLFSYPKSLWNVYDLLKHTLWKEDWIILDFFAGSGTTGHAVLELNREDGGRRQCILCTNNENGIAEEVTYPRMRNVIRGYADVDGIPANLRYYTTAFIDVDRSIDDLRSRFMGRCTEMLQIRESCFRAYEAEGTSEYFQVFQSNEALLAILYHPYEIEKLRSLVAGAQRPVVAYIFSMGAEIFREELAEFSDRLRIETIPDEILETYKKIFGF